MKPGIRFVLAAACCAALPGNGAVAPQKPELQELRTRIEALQKELDDKEGAKADAADALKTSEQAISKINGALRSLAERQRQADATLSELLQRKDALDKRIAGEQEMLGKMLHQQYLSGQRDQFKILLNQENPNLSTRQLHYYGYLVKARAQLLESLRANLTQLARLTQDTQAKQAELAQIRTDQDGQKEQLLVQQRERKKLVTQLAQQIGEQRSELSQLQRNEKHLTDLIERLARLPPPRKKPEPATKRHAAPSETPAAEAEEAAAAGKGAFRQLKGKLRLPVHGELAGRFGTPRQDGGASWKGVFIRASAGQEVHAIATGRVVFADWLRGFGNLIIVDHGGGYMSLYGNNEALFKQAGEDVRGGEAIASTGNSGGNPETGLYFELRFQSKPFDPLTWCRQG